MVFAFEWVQLYSRHAHAHARGPRRGDTIFQLKIAVNTRIAENRNSVSDSYSVKYAELGIL